MNVIRALLGICGLTRRYSVVPAFRLSAVSVLVAMTTLPTQADLVQFDFNDNTAGALAGQSGGTEATSWIAGAPHIVQAGDLTAPVSTNFGLTQSVGTAQSVANTSTDFTMGQITRDFDSPLTGDPNGNVWFSFLADVIDGGSRAGIGWGNTSGTTTNPRLLFLNDGIQYFGTGGSTLLGSGFAGQTNLVVGRIGINTSGTTDELSFWVNPNVNAPLPAPLYTATVGDSFGTSVGSVNIQSYGTLTSAVDFISFSDTATAFIDVTGATPLTAAEWIATGSGGWEIGTNWDISQAPDGLDTTFGTAITGPATVTLDADRSVRELVFNNSNSYTLTANKLTVDGDITNSQGSHTIASDLEFVPGTRTFTSATGASLAVTGTTTFTSDGAGTLVLDGTGGGSIGAIRDSNSNVAVVKRGSGTWNIGSGTSTAEDFHGLNTTIEAGTLAVRANAPGGTTGELRSPVIDVQTGATFDTSNFSTYSLGVGQTLRGGGEIDAGGTGTLQVFSDNIVIPGDSAGTLNIDGNLRLNAFEGASPTGSLQFELSSSTASGNDQIAVTGNVISNAGGGGNVTSVSIIPIGTTLQNGGTYELITFDGTHTGSAADYQLDTSLQTRFTQSISVDSDSVNLDIVGSNAALAWRGNDGANPTFWDVNTTSNWDNGGPDVFYDLDSVTFDDTAVGTTVSIRSNLTPASVTFNNTTKDFSTDPNSPGGIAGGGSVTKSGTGRITINNANTYTGETNITSGVLHAANNAALGDTSGGTTVNGGALDITGSDISGEVVTIQGAGSDGRGALMTDGFDSLGDGTPQINHVVQSGPATIAAYSDQPADSVFPVNNYRWDLEPPTAAPDSDASWTGNGHALTKKGRGTVAIQRVGEMGGGDVNIEQGALIWIGTTTSTGATVTVGDGVTPYINPTEASGTASFETYYDTFTGPASAGGVHAIDLVLQGGAFNHGGTIQDITISGTVTNSDVSGDSTIDNRIGSGGSQVTIVNGITGDGDIEFGGGSSGTIELQGNNTYTGTTSIDGVTVALVGSSGLSSSPDIEAGGTIDASGRTDSTLTTSGQTLDLAASTAVVGDLVTSANSVLKVFGDGSTSTGSSTVTLTQSQFRRTRHNPNTNQDDAGVQPGGELFVGPISASVGANGNNDIARGFLEFDLTSEISLVGVTDITSVSLTMIRSGTDNTSLNVNHTLELNELTQTFVEDEITPSSASSGNLWTGYTADGDADACVAANCALGSLLSTEVGNPTVFADVEFTDNQGGAFEAYIESVLAGSGLANFRVNADATAENSAGRAFLKFGSASLEITFNGTIVDVGSSLVDGDFTLDATSTLKLDLFDATKSDLLDVSGAATLAGTIDATLLAGSTLDPNDQITVLTTANGITDSGLSVSGPFTHSIVGNDLVLTFTGGLAGDFDGNGRVDSLDFLAWQRNPSIGSLSDWEANYGLPTTSNATSVPEPTSFILLGMGSLGLLIRKRG